MGTNWTRDDLPSVDDCADFGLISGKVERAITNDVLHFVVDRLNTHHPKPASPDSAVHVIHESDLPAARVDGDDYLVEDPKGDYRWPKHGASWWEDRAQDALTKAARFTALARLAAAREAAVDPVEELAGQIETATRAAIRQLCDDLADVAPALDPLTVERAMEVTAASRKVAAHVLGE